MFEITSVCRGGGYLYCRTRPQHPKANSKGLYPYHRVLMENAMGRLLDRDEVVHHKDGDKGNNSTENLAVLSRSEHSAGHQEVERLEYVCLCGKSFFLREKVYLLRMKRNESGLVFCSRSCSVKHQHSREQ